MRSVLVQSFTALSAASLAAGGCGGAAPLASAPPASASAQPSFADPAIAAPRPPEPPPEPSAKPSPKPPINPSSARRVIVRPGVLTVGSVSREVWSIDPQAQGDALAVDRWLRLPTLLDISNKKSDFWSPCVRDFVQLQPEVARDMLGEALSLYSTACTGGPSRRVEFQTPRTGRTAPAQSYLGLVGALERRSREAQDEEREREALERRSREAQDEEREREALEPTSCELALRAAYHGPSLRAQRITLIADGVRWSSPRIDFDDDDGWEIATLPLTRELARVVKRTADARDALLRFETDRAYEDVVLTDDAKQDLRVMLDALDAIHRP